MQASERTIERGSARKEMKKINIGSKLKGNRSIFIGFAVANVMILAQLEMAHNNNHNKIHMCSCDHDAMHTVHANQKQ